MPLAAVWGTGGRWFESCRSDQFFPNVDVVVVVTDSVDACLCFVSLGPRDDGLAIGRVLVEERLAAAVNVQHGMRSCYRWQGAVEEAAEALLIAKTRAKLVPRLTARVIALHSYECPAVVAVPICGGNPDYLAWIEAETT
jgi:periplasmic divalent cation tolerance protein